MSARTNQHQQAHSTSANRRLRDELKAWREDNKNNISITDRVFDHQILKNRMKQKSEKVLRNERLLSEHKKRYEQQFAPGGPGYERAKRSFYELAAEQKARKQESEKKPNAKRKREDLAKKIVKKAKRTKY